MSCSEKKAKIVGINGRFTHSCLALFYVRNELVKKYPELATEILQFTINDNYYEMLLRLSNDSPDYIFFSVAIWNSDLIEKLTRDLRLSSPECKVIIGGPQASVLRQKLAGDDGSLDCCIITGEIEAVGDGFFSDLRSGQIKSNYYGSFFKMQKPWFDFPYQPDDFTTHLKNRHIYYESSRGCPFKCSYCLSSGEKRLYHKDLKTVQDELRSILKHKPKVIRFIDRTFNDVPDRALAIWKFLQAEGGETLFHFEMAPDRFSTEMLEFLSSVKCGTFQFELGIQSTNKKTLEAVQRKVDSKEAALVIQRLAGLESIHLHVDLILGLPYETETTFAVSFRDVFAMGAHYIQMGLLKILPDTPLCYSALDHGYKHSSQTPYSILENRWLDHQTLSRLYWFSECVEKFHNNRYFVTFWRYLRFTEKDIYQFFDNLLKSCLASEFFQYAATQELMCEKLVELCIQRSDRDIILDLLRYDWLRCNHRFLPECLVPDGKSELPQQIRASLYQSMPAEMEGVYSKQNRNQFFRKSFFLRISKNAAEYIDISVSTERAQLCFLPIREGGLNNYNKVLIF